MSFSLRKTLLFILNNNIRTNSFLTRLLFGIRISGKKRIHWDFTTLLLKKNLKKYIRNGMRILEIGTGPFALLSIYLSKKYDCEYDACDINEEYIQSAMVVAGQNNPKINIFVSNLFAKVNGLYDIIFFNSVYIPKSTGIKMGIDKFHNYSTDWCGGEKGYEVIEKYLENSILHIKNEGIIILGVNYLYLDKLSLNDIICKYKIKIVKQYSSKLNPSTILLFKKI